jgi:PAS domain S-box-containing protein
MHSFTETLQDRDEQLRLLVDSITDYAIFLLDADGRVASWNPGAQRIKGYTAEQILGVHFSAFYPAEDVAAGKPDQGLRVALGEGRFEEDGWRVRRGGERFWANVVITPMYDDDGQLRGFAKITRDLTERRRTEEVAQRLALVEQQERIALDVSDTIVSGLFSVGMNLQGIAARIEDEAVRRRLDGAVGDLDKAIRALRSYIFKT